MGGWVGGWVGGGVVCVCTILKTGVPAGSN